MASFTLLLMSHINPIDHAKFREKSTKKSASSNKLYFLLSKPYLSLPNMFTYTSRGKQKQLSSIINTVLK